VPSSSTHWRHKQSSLYPRLFAILPYRDSTHGSDGQKQPNHRARFVVVSMEQTLEARRIARERLGRLLSALITAVTHPERSPCRKADAQDRSLNIP
jgi:hypothetical protein